MDGTISKLEASRRKGKNQADEQRTNILDTAEKLFLDKGLENTNMTDIAAEAGISRVSLYRYFPDLHPIAFETAVRMMRRIFEAFSVAEQGSDFELFRVAMITSIEQFYELRDAHRFMGMFDHLYGAGYPTEELSAWYKEQLGLSKLEVQYGSSEIAPEQIVMIGNCVLSFLQKLAARGDLMAEEQEVSLDKQLGLFKEMVNVYFDHLADLSQSKPIKL